jgi:hypothetical protein
MFPAGDSSMRAGRGLSPHRPLRAGRAPVASDLPSVLVSCESVDCTLISRALVFVILRDVDVALYPIHLRPKAAPTAPTRFESERANAAPSQDAILPAHKRKVKRGRKPLDASLPREVVRDELREASA